MEKILKKTVVLYIVLLLVWLPYTLHSMEKKHKNSKKIKAGSSSCRNLNGLSDMGLQEGSVDNEMLKIIIALKSELAGMQQNENKTRELAIACAERIKEKEDEIKMLQSKVNELSEILEKLQLQKADTSKKKKRKRSMSNGSQLEKKASVRFAPVEK